MENSTVFKNLTPDDVKQIVSDSVQAALERINKPKSYTSRREVCKKFNLSLPTVDARIKDGTFSTIRIGHRIFVDLENSNLAATRRKK